MSSFLFSEQEEPFQAQQSPSPPSSPSNPYEKALARQRSNSSSAGSKNVPRSPSATSTGLARQPSFGAAGQAVGASPRGGGGLFRKRTNSFGTSADGHQPSHENNTNGSHSGPGSPPRTNNDLVQNNESFDDIPERDEESPGPAPVWERRKSMIVRAEEREREQRIQRELQAYQAQQEAERKAREQAEQSAKSGKGLFNRSKSKSAVDKPSKVTEPTASRGSKEMSPSLKVPVTSSRRRPHSMLQMTSSSTTTPTAAVHRSMSSDQDPTGQLAAIDDISGPAAVHSSEDLDAPLPMPNAAFLNGGYSSPGHSRRSSASSQRGSVSHRSSAYGSPLGLTGDGLNMSLPTIPSVPDQSNPSRPATERPLDTIRAMSMRSEGNMDGMRSGTHTPGGSLSNGGKRRSKIPLQAGMQPGLVLDESIWPSAPVNMVGPASLGKPVKSRSSVSLVSLGRNNKPISKSTPTSPHMVKGKQNGDTISPVSTRSTMGRNSMFGTPAAISREYMIPFSHREGGYAIAANMHGGGPPGSRAGSIDYGRQMRYNRYSTESGMDDYGMYNRGLNGSRPSLPGQSTSTSTTSLYQPEYQAPPSSFPPHMSSDPNVMPGLTTGLSKTPSPLSNATSSAAERTPGNPIDMEDMGLQMRTRQQTPATALPSAIATSISTPGVNNAQLSTPADSTPSEPTSSANPATPKAVAMKKSKKELAKEAKAAKERQKAEEKQKATDAARKKADDAREKMKREQQERAQKEADKKAAKAQAKKVKEQAKLNKESAGKSKPTPAALVMPATPLKGRTKDLSAATPTTLPGTPATPAEPVRLLDTASLAGQSTIAKPSPLSAQPLSGTAQNDETSKNTSNISQTPRREGVLASNPSAQSPPIPSVKSKRSFFGTLRRKFSSSPSPAASTRSMGNGREGRSTPASGPSGAASLLSVRKPETISETPSTLVAQDKTNQSSETSSPAPQTQADAPPASAGVGIAEEIIEGNERDAPNMTLATAAELPTANDGPDIPIDSTKESVNASHAPVQDDGPEKPYSNGTLANQTEKTLARMIDKAREGGLDVDLHVKYIQELDTKTDELAYHMTEHLRINGVYWGLVALCLLNRPDALNREDMIKYVLTCWDDEAGAFGAHPRHDGHILGTLSAIQILAIQDALHVLDKDRIVKFIISLIDPVTGAVAGDRWGEQDTRFSYIAISILSLIGRLDVLDTALDGKARDLVVGHIARCRNFDGGFGATEGSESHGGQIFVCVAALAILDRLDLVDTPTLAWWISERQLPNGGLNGRPEKLEDVCYSWWNLSALSILGKLHWINREELIRFILKSQDLDNGGIADRPGDWVDVFHTNFGLAGLSLLGYSGLQDIDPVYCMPVSVIERLGLKKRYQLLPKNTNDAVDTANVDGIVDLSVDTTVRDNKTSPVHNAPALAPALPVLTNGVTANIHDEGSHISSPPRV